MHIAHERSLTTIMKSGAVRATGRARVTAPKWGYKVIVGFALMAMCGDALGARPSAMVSV